MTVSVVPVFVSSTWLDLISEHEAAERAIQTLRETKYVGMKYFGSRDETTRQASLDEVDRSRVYVGIIAARYGSGITEDEYRRARHNGIPCFIYFKSDAVVAPDKRETDTDKAARLVALKQELRGSHTVKEFTSPEDLAAKVTADLHRWLFDNYLTPKLQGALRGEVPRADAQALLDAVKDLSALSRDLLTQLQSKGFSISIEGDFVAHDKVVNIYNAPGVPVPTLHQLRAPVGDFVGREKEIADLLATLRGGGSAAISGISGMGGIGKTELALLVAERLRDAYPDAQLVLDMRGTDERPRDPADALASCIRGFVGLEQRLPDDLEELKRLYTSVLEGKRALLLLDNAYDGAQVRPLLPPKGSALLVTSRETIPIPGMKRVTLEQLQPVEARELLTGIAPRVAPDIADRICYLCGYLPLAVRAAASLLDVTVDLDAEEYAAQLADERTRLERIGTDPLLGVSVEASFNLSYARLSPDAAHVFRCLAVFSATFDAVAEEAVCEDAGHKHLSELVRRNLVLFNGDTHRYRLHDLARIFADFRLSDEERSAGRMRHAKHYLDVLWETDKLYKEGSEAVMRGLALFDLEWQNIQAGQSWAEKQSGENDAAAALCSDYPDAGIYLLSLRQHPRERISWLKAALTTARRLKDRAAEGNVLGNLGNAYADLGETRRAVEFYEQQLVITREIGDRRGEGNALGNLGNAYAALGETRRAIEYHEQALVIDREIGDRRGEGQDLGNLGTAYAALGEPRRAIEFYEQRLAIAREIGDRRGEGNALYNTSLALDKLGDRAQAIAHAEDALEIYEQIESPAAAKARAVLAQWRGEA